MELFKNCQKYLSCSVNACPLDTDSAGYTDERDKEKVCKLKPAEVLRIFNEKKLCVEKRT
jgi:hypothetical protein